MTAAGGARAATSSATVRRRPLARTFSRARWKEYERLLTMSLERGFAARSLEQWLADGAPYGRYLVLRHDVDQHPACALRMARIEADAGVRATWYFRWRTAAPAAIAEIRELGGEIGLHYETLTRIALRRGYGPADIDVPLVGEARRILRAEIAAFEDRFGPVRTAAAHGDTRVPGVQNKLLLWDEDPAAYGLVADANFAVHGKRLSVWLTDRTRADGRWLDGLDPERILAECDGPVLCLTHPNNWCSGPSLWADRARSRILPAPRPDRNGSPLLGLRTGTDDPHLRRAEAEARPSVDWVGTNQDFAPIERSLEREILRSYYERGRSLSDDAGQRTLATNSTLAERRAELVEASLAELGLDSVRGLGILDVGCGFGALALALAAHGAEVTACDPNPEWMRVGQTVAEEHGLELEWRIGRLPGLSLRPRHDVAVLNNSLCFIVSSDERLQALRELRRGLRPAGVLVIRDPNRQHPVDPFTKLPLLALLRPAAARRLARILRRRRPPVRLRTPRAARRELRRAGFVDVRTVRLPRRSRLQTLLGSHYHVVGRRPAES